MTPDELNLVLNLAKARELLIADKDFVPVDGQAQRRELMANFDRITDKVLAESGPLPTAMPPEQGPLASQAWDYLQERQRHPVTADAQGGTAFENLKRAFAEKNALEEANGVLGWQQQTEILRAQGASDADYEPMRKAINSAKVALQVLSARTIARPQVGEWVTQVRADSAALADETDKRNFALMEKQWISAVGLGEKLIKDFNDAYNDCYDKWVDAKKKPEPDKPNPAYNNYDMWLPSLEHTVQMAQQQGDAMLKAFPQTAGATHEEKRYQTFLDTNNPGLNNADITREFANLRERLPALIQTIRAKQSVEQEISGAPIPLPDISAEDQVKVAKRVMRDLGLNESFARVDKAPHPFSGGQGEDIRITTRAGKDVDMMTTLIGLIHETGHGLYSHGLPKDQAGQPIGESAGMWVHETQSLFWEKQVALSPEFMEYLSNVFHQELGLDGPAFEAKNLQRLVTRVEPNLIRVAADEVTYPMHVILRHELEQKLLDGSLKPKDLPEAWNKKIKELLGVDVPKDDFLKGCMQDVHWSSGIIGSFPGYTYGALGAAQLMEKLQEEKPQVGELIKQGKFGEIREWLEEKIHKHGAAKDGDALFIEATGKPLSSDAWFRQIEKRYLAPKQWERNAATPASTRDFTWP